MLKSENTELRSQLDDRDLALESANDELRNSNRNLRDHQEAFTTAQATWDAEQVSTADAFAGIEGVHATYGPNDVTVTVEGDVLFSSGKSTLRDGAKSSLNRVATVLKDDFSGKSIVIAGHTDADPIKKSGHKSNYHLGFERGWAVRNYLASRGVRDGQMAIISYGPDRPRGSSNKSRRVEIVVAD
jgi:outer membrane protein OmpA-like peptidoglycan-associated protein